MRMNRFKWLPIFLLAVTATTAFNYQLRDNLADFSQESTEKSSDLSVGGGHADRLEFSDDLDDVSAVLLENRLRPAARLDTALKPDSDGRLRHQPVQAALASAAYGLRLSFFKRSNTTLSGLPGTQLVVSRPNTTAPPAL